MDYGLKVTIKLGAPFNAEQVLRNVTEIHYGYGANDSRIGDGTRVAFESHIHGTGWTCTKGAIIEFETEAETEKADEF